MGKNSFLLYTSDYKCVKDLPLEQKGALLDAIFEYASTGTIIDLPPVVSMAFNFFRSHIDDNTEKWNEKVEKRRAAGRLGGLAKAENSKQSQANLANAKDAKQSQANVANLAVNVNDNVNVNVSTEVDIKENTIVSKKDELSLSSPSEEFIKFNQWLDEHCPFVLKVKTQMTEPEYQKLLAKYTKKEISDVLESLNNWKDFPKKRTNVYRSTLDELKKKFGER
ncbi:DUF6291 domain-containing protein [Bacteroides zhangwenhongii]|jgi:hypothetical protein|uniref:DUF6291 domain-containing protein n=2 Tax=Bacteroides TaxID=816 RepID=A0ABT5H6R3_9BACE|nr:DUF6291 domain-containing protein [Bacteroides zhangwenhongii]MDC7136179.1 DUF6291 domain-containing protein [Bacteroides zhangwenhongii]